MALITVGVALAFGLNNRNLNSQLNELKAHLTGLESQAPVEADASNAIEAYLAGLRAEKGTEQAETKLLTSVLENVKSPSDTYYEPLPVLIRASGLIGDSESADELQQRINELEEQLANGVSDSTF